MKNINHKIWSAPKEAGTSRFLAAFVCLLLLGGPSSVFGQAPSLGSDERGGADEEESDSATGDETVGTLPSMVDPDPPGSNGATNGPTGVTRSDVQHVSRDGALILDGGLEELAGLLGRTRTNGLFGLEIGAAGHSRVSMLGDFRLRIRAAALAELELGATLTSEEGLLANVTWDNRSHTFELGAGATFALPLDELLTSSALARSPLVVESINPRGEVTRLTMSLDRGFIVLSQTRR